MPSEENKVGVPPDVVNSVFNSILLTGKNRQSR